MYSTIGGDDDCQNCDKEEELFPDILEGGGVERINVNGDSFARCVRECFCRFRSLTLVPGTTEAGVDDRCRFVSEDDDVDADDEEEEDILDNQLDDKLNFSHTKKHTSNLIVH